MKEEAREKDPPERIMADVLWLDPVDRIGGYGGIKEYLRKIRS